MITNFAVGTSRDSMKAGLYPITTMLVHAVAHVGSSIIGVCSRMLAKNIKAFTLTRPARLVSKTESWLVCCRRMFSHSLPMAYVRPKVFAAEPWIARSCRERLRDLSDCPCGVAGRSVAVLFRGD